jgi:hypothetical protein
MPPENRSAGRAKGKRPSGSWRSSEVRWQANHRHTHTAAAGRLCTAMPQVPSSIERNPDSLHLGLLKRQCDFRNKRSNLAHISFHFYSVNTQRIFNPSLFPPSPLRNSDTACLNLLPLNGYNFIIGFCILLRVILTVNSTFCFSTIDKVFYYVAYVLTTCFGP